MPEISSKNLMVRLRRLRNVPSSIYWHKTSCLKQAARTRRFPHWLFISEAPSLGKEAAAYVWAVPKTLVIIGRSPSTRP